MSGDGQVVAFVQYDMKVLPPGGIGEPMAQPIAWYLMNVPTRTVRTIELPKDAHGMQLSYDGGSATVSAGPLRSGMVFFIDLTTDDSTPVSVSTDGERGNDDSWGGSMSRDTRYIVFDSDATNLVADDTNGARDVFLRDRIAGRTTRVSVTSSAEQADGMSMEGLISDDGSWIFFMSAASNLSDPSCGDPDPNGWHWTTFVRDRTAGTVETLSEGHHTLCQGVGSLSRDASRLLLGVGYANLRVLDRTTGNATRVLSCPADEPGETGDDPAMLPDMSAGGYQVVSGTTCALVESDSNHVADIYLFDLGPGTTERVSVPDGT